MKNVGDVTKFLHVQDVTPILEQAYKERMAVGNAHNYGREWEKVASIPGIVLVEHPEFYEDQKALYKWLKSDEGRGYRTSTRNL